MEHAKRPALLAAALVLLAAHTLSAGTFPPSARRVDFLGDRITYRGQYVVAFEGSNAVLGRYSAWLCSQRDQGWSVIDIHGPMNLTQLWNRCSRRSNMGWVR